MHRIYMVTCIVGPAYNLNLMASALIQNANETKALDSVIKMICWTNNVKLDVDLYLFFGDII